MSIVLRGEKLVLRDITEADFQKLYYHYHEAEDREHLKWDGPYKSLTHQRFEKFTEDYIGHLALVETETPRNLLIIEIDGKVKGKVGRYWISQETNWMEIGIVIFDSSYWSGGYGTEAFKMWIDYLFNSLDTVRLGIGTWSGNKRMIGLAAKCGMVEEARVRKARIVRGEYYDAIKMGILREEWENAGNLSAKDVCDLHTHTQASDGMQPPAENVRLAKEKGLSAVAITDHDTVAGVKEACEAGEKYGITVVPGVEISTRAGGKDIHVLGYYVDPENEQFLSRLEGLRDTRALRNEAIITKLQDLGIAITLEQVIAGIGRELKPDESIGRPHIADELVRLGAATDMRDAFNKYLAEDAAAYVSPPRITPEEACEWIIEAGGSPVLAHPGLYGDDLLVRDILEQGAFKGIEVYHSDHGPAEEERYQVMAEDYNLLITGGSDFHGARQGVIFHGDIGSVTVSTEVLKFLNKKA